MGDPSVVCKSLGGTAGQNGSCVLSPPDEQADLKDWAYVLNFRPKAVTDSMKQRFPNEPEPYYHAIEDGYGALNLDFYAVQIMDLPSVGGTKLSAEQMLTDIRTNFNDVLDQSVAPFDAYYPNPDGTTWGSSTPLGAVMHFHIKVPAMPDDGAAVVCAEHASDHWIFSTLPTPFDDDHPVSGNRQFGIAVLPAGAALPDVYQKAGVTLDNRNGDALYFYTRGADRCTSSQYYVASATMNSVFAGGHACWLALQQKLTARIIGQGGRAVVAGNVSERWDWEGIKRPGMAGGCLWHAPAR
jgi:hypothetical protein